MMLLKYRLNNVCDPKGIRNIVVVNTQLLIYLAFPTVKKANTHYLRIKCVLRR